MSITTSQRTLSAHVITWALGRRTVVLERRGATWRMMLQRRDVTPTTVVGSLCR